MKKSLDTKKALLRHLLGAEKGAVHGLTKVLNGAFDDAVELLSRTNGKIVVSGMGKSGHIGVKVAATMTSLS